MFPTFYYILFTGFSVCSLLAGTVMSFRVKRADDNNPLQEVVDQLSQQLVDLAAKVTVLETKNAKLDTTVAFHAWGDTNPVRTVALGTIILNHAVTNVGNAYDTMAGVFTAPVSGLYDFQASIMDYDLNNSEYAHAGLYVDNARVAIALSDPRHGYYSQVTMKAIVHLNAGQRVYLKNIDSETNNYYDSTSLPYTTFTGFLIHAN